MEDNSKSANIGKRNPWEKKTRKRKYCNYISKNIVLKLRNTKDNKKCIQMSRETADIV